MKIKYSVITTPESNRINTFMDQKCAMNFEVFIAPSIDESLKSFDVVKFAEAYGRNARPGEVGCAVSHNILQRQRGFDWHIIVEDDAIFCEHFQMHISTLVKYCDPRDIVILGQSRTLKRDDWFRKLKQPLTNSATLPGQLKIGEKNYLNKFGTVGYMVGGSAAHLIAMNKDSLYEQADDWSRFQEKYGIKITHLSMFMVHEDLHDYLSSTGNVTKIRNNLRQNLIKELIGMFIRQIQHKLRLL